ncbi:tRNA dimethylallyltransferase, mitochondrial [Coemansia sp. RSA 2705]|nr:tRNA dimethylallyltransferase, mitochondrial [Coemansia sp. RSA 2705]
MSLVRKGLIAIIGTTGVGKSQLAVDIARAVDGEVINADALQVYAGYDIITNKVSSGEAQGVAHHLLGVVPAHREYTVQEFERDALKKIAEIHQRNRVPILVGGTNYYIQSTMFGKSLIRQAPQGTGRQFEAAHQNKTNQELWQELRQKDPVMAENWHPNNRRKVLRSLEVLQTTGKRHSEWIKDTEQAREREETLRFPTLLLWLYADSEQLIPRLDARVDTMVSRGMFGEIEQLACDISDPQVLGGVAANDFSVGLKQAIGFREFQPYLQAVAAGDASTETLETLKAAGIENMKTATRQYAKRQIAWIRNKTLPECKTTLKKRQQAQAFVLDATDLAQWNTDVRDRGIQLAKSFICGGELPDAKSLSARAAALLADVKDPGSMLAWKKHHCRVCSTDEVQVWLNGEDEYRQHMRSRRHRRNELRERKSRQFEQAADSARV